MALEKYFVWDQPFHETTRTFLSLLLSCRVTTSDSRERPRDNRFGARSRFAVGWREPPGKFEASCGQFSGVSGGLSRRSGEWA